VEGSSTDPVGCRSAVFTPIPGAQLLASYYYAIPTEPCGPKWFMEELGNTDANVRSPSVVTMEEREDEELVFLKVAEAGQKVLKLYRQLHRVHLVNYTFLATHHLFMAGKFYIVRK
jgi:hypothetical protein